MTQPQKDKQARQYKITERRVVFEGYHHLEIAEMHPQSLRHEGWATPIQREIFHAGECAVVLLYHPESDSILMNEQFRAAPCIMGDENPWLLECCAGVIDEGETPEEAALRESLEETGMPILDLLPIAKVYPSPGTLAEIYHLFCGRIDDPQHGGVFGLEEEGEEIKTHLFPADELIALMDAGKITNAGALMCIQWFARHRVALRARWMPT